MGRGMSSMELTLNTRESRAALLDAVKSGDKDYDSSLYISGNGSTLRLSIPFIYAIAMP